jgi:hypothetical protein
VRHDAVGVATQHHKIVRRRRRDGTAARLLRAPRARDDDDAVTGALYHRVHCDGNAGGRLDALSGSATVSTRRGRTGVASAAPRAAASLPLARTAPFPD